MATTDYIIYFMVIALSAQAFLFMGQTSAQELNPTGNPLFYNPQNSLLCGFEGNNCLNKTIAPDLAGVNGNVPQSQSSVSSTGFYLFTDTPTFLISWFRQQLSGIINFFFAPFIFLTSTGLPQYVVGILSLIWYGLISFLFIAFFAGR